MPRVIDFLDEFIEAVKADLERGEKRWGDTWLKRTIAGQDERFRQYFNDRFDRAINGNEPVRYESFAGDALIGWIRVHHPELFPDGKE